MDATPQYAENVLNPQFSMKSTISITSLPISKSVLKKKYLKNYLSITEIAKEFSCSKTSILEALKKHKIKKNTSIHLLKKRENNGNIH